MKKADIKNYTRDQLASWFQDRGIKPFRVRQLFKWLYLHQADTFDIMTDLSKDIRKLLKTHFVIKRLETVNIETSQDSSRKYLFKLEDGKYTESVLIPEKSHTTICISSQVGCALGCRFCLSAKDGFERNLTLSEIVGQVRDIQNDLNGPKPLTNIVFMGIGEPLANYENVINAINIFTDSDFGFKFSTRRITLSTAGLIPKFSDLGQDTNINLAISLNAANNKIRNMLMPVNCKYPIEKLIDACTKYPLPARRKITFEYILINEINDSSEDAIRLAKLLRPVKAKINVIPYNSYQGSCFKRPNESVIQNFLKILHDKDYTAIIRYSKGQDISAACGQLRAKRFLESAQY